MADPADVKARQTEELQEIKVRLRARTEDIARTLMGDPNIQAGGQFRYGQTGAFVVTTKGPDRGKFYNHADTSQNGDMLDLIALKRSESFHSAVQWARDYLGMPRPDHSRPISAAEKQRMGQRQESLARIEAENQQRQAALVTARQERVARRAEFLWAGYGPATDSHPYVASKRMSPAGMRLSRRGVLVSPMRDDGGKLWNLQRIRPNGEKRFIKWGRAKGLFDVLGTVDPTKPVAFAEGRATGDAVHSSTGLPTVVCYSLGEKARIMRDWRAKNPSQRLLDAVDNDTGKARNAGLETAERLKTEIGSVPVVPLFPEGAEGTDWKDYQLLYDADAVSKQFERHTQTQEVRMPEGMMPGAPKPAADMTAEQKQLIERLAARTHQDSGADLTTAVRAAKQYVSGMDPDAVQRTLADLTKKSEAPVDPLLDVIRQMKAGIEPVAKANPTLALVVDNLAQRTAEQLQNAILRTRVAYAVEDFEKAKGTPLTMPDGVRQEMTALARSYPGLDNKDMEGLLARTKELRDPAVVAAIRRTASDLGKSGEAQHMQDAQERVEALARRVGIQGPAQAPANVVPSPGPGPQTPAPEAAPPKPAQPMPPPPQAPAQPLVSSQPQGGIASNFMRERRDLGPSRLPWQQITAGMDQNAIAFQHRMDDGKGRRLLAAATTGADDALKAVEGFYRGQGKPLMDRIEAAGAGLPNGSQDVVSEMRAGGKFAHLRQEFDRAMTDPRFSAAYTGMQKALDGYGMHRRDAVSFIESRELPKEGLRALERVDAALGEKAAAVPGIEPGRSLLDETTAKLSAALREAAQKTASMVASAMTSVKQHFQSPSPAP